MKAEQYNLNLSPNPFVHHLSFSPTNAQPYLRQKVKHTIIKAITITVKIQFHLANYSLEQYNMSNIIVVILKPKIALLNFHSVNT